jgi:hypothetical protein
MPTQDTPIPESILELHTQLEQFRSTHPRRTRLPVTLWQSAAELARQHGIYTVAHSLRLDYTTLKKYVNGCSAPGRPRRTKVAAAKFIELIGAAHARVDEYVIEFESDDRPKLRIHCKTATPPNWAALLDAWRRVE